MNTYLCPHCVQGKTSMDEEEEGDQLGQFAYSLEGPAIQEFSITVSSCCDIACSVQCFIANFFLCCRRNPPRPTNMSSSSFSQTMAVVILPVSTVCGCMDTT